MTRTCQFAFGDRSGPAEWAFDEVTLVVSPAGGRPLVIPVQEMAGIGGDGCTIGMAVPGSPMPAPTGEARATVATVHPRLALSKLGVEGPALLDTLRRTWLVARAKALRLGGCGEGRPFSGLVAGPVPRMAAEPFRALLFEDVMVIAREGRDLEPIFLALIEETRFAQAACTTQVSEWPGGQFVFSKMSRQTQDFVDSLRANREALAHESAAIFASALPSLSAAHRELLAGEWPPGRLRSLSDLEERSPGFEQAFRGIWLAGAPRQKEGSFLLDWAGPPSCWLGCSREASETGEALAWLLAEKNGTWFLEALTGEDRATYYFSGGEEIPALVSRLLCTPQFSKEALYGGPQMLTGERADLAIAAQFLHFLADLRERFEGRLIHASPENWITAVEAAAGGGLCPPSEAAAGG